MMTKQVNLTDIDCKFEVTGASYIGKPVPNTAMFVSKKVEYLVENLRDVSNCLVFAENGITVAEEIAKNHCFVYSDKPQLQYALFTSKLAEERYCRDKNRKVTFVNNSYYLGENVTIGNNVDIMPGCFIGHDVVIGDNTRIFSGAKIQNAVIGHDVIIRENAVVGAVGFTMAEDDEGNLFRIPTLGKVLVGNYVEIGVNNNVSAGTGGNTVIESYVKLDSLVHVAHDNIIHSNVEIASGVVLAGMVEIHEGTFMGVNSSVRPMLTIGKNVTVGMGAAVTKDVMDGATVCGNPARRSK